MPRMLRQRAELKPDYQPRAHSRGSCACQAVGCAAWKPKSIRRLACPLLVYQAGKARKTPDRPGQSAELTPYNTRRSLTALDEPGWRARDSGSVYGGSNPPRPTTLMFFDPR